VTPVMPSEGGNGLAMRAGVLLEGLARSHRVRVLVAPVFGRPPPPDPFVARRAAGVDVLRADRTADRVASTVARLATAGGRERAAVLHPLPALCGALTPTLADEVAVAAEGCAAVAVMRLYLAPLLDALLDRERRPPLVLDADDVESPVHAGRGDHAEAEAYGRLEAYYLPRVDRVLVCCREDARLLARLRPRPRVVVISNAVRPGGPQPPPAGRHDLLFVGNLSYAPNVEGVRWLCEGVLPLLPGVSAALVGSAPTAEVRALAAARDVRVAPDVPDVGPWYAGARVAVAPVLAGGGTRIKVLEALAHRRPVVATAAGARGLDLAGPGGAVLVADSPSDFAATCRMLLSDPGLRRRLGERGARWVADSATVERVAGSIDLVLAGIVSA
jgi:glycosyltransferase involved in cell wall biosynthesis